MYRELNEEVGLEREDVEILHLRPELVPIVCRNVWSRTHSQPLCIGQKRKSFLLRLIFQRAAGADGFDR